MLYRSTMLCPNPHTCTSFFFSSRRRHTRFDCDWSSDVCSSDLQRDFVGMVERVLSSTGLAPMRLELEITETVAMQTSDRTLAMVHDLRKMGIAISVDDFGTGQSSLSYLKRFPVDTVKIDRSFVQDIINGENDEWIITAILMLANHLVLRTIAEGVESEIQCRFLAGHDCREIQGYLISKPVSAAEFAEKFLPKRLTERVPRAAQL